MMITEDDIKNKTPNLEQTLLEFARELGAEKAIMFDGSEVQLRINIVNKDYE